MAHNVKLIGDYHGFPTKHNNMANILINKTGIFKYIY